MLIFSRRFEKKTKPFLLMAALLLVLTLAVRTQAQDLSPKLHPANYPHKYTFSVSKLPPLFPTAQLLLNYKTFPASKSQHGCAQLKNAPDNGCLLHTRSLGFIHTPLGMYRVSMCSLLFNAHTRIHTKHGARVLHFQLEWDQVINI